MPWPSHPSIGAARRKRARTAGRHRVARKQAGWSGWPAEVPPPAPQSKPITLVSRLVARIAPLVAFGLGLRILAAGPAVLRPYSFRGALHEPVRNSSR